MSILHGLVAGADTGFVDDAASSVHLSAHTRWVSSERNEFASSSTSLTALALDRWSAQSPSQPIVQAVEEQDRTT
ncbi:hypothetical protein VTO73DRAFT_15315 [Trametes versicolor]